MVATTGVKLNGLRRINPRLARASLLQNFVAWASSLWLLDENDRLEAYPTVFQQAATCPAAFGGDRLRRRR